MPAQVDISRTINTIFGSSCSRPSGPGGPAERNGRLRFLKKYWLYIACTGNGRLGGREAGREAGPGHSPAESHRIECSADACLRWVRHLRNILCECLLTSRPRTVTVHRRPLARRFDPGPRRGGLGLGGFLGFLSIFAFTEMPAQVDISRTINTIFGSSCSRPSGPCGPAGSNERLQKKLAHSFALLSDSKP